MKIPTCRWRERTMENRYKVWELLRRMKKTLECAICLDLLSDPYSSHCNHPFCRACITTVISSNKRPNCPLCKEPISRRSIHENTRLAEIVDSVKGLEDAVMKESGIASTPPRPVPDSQVARGTPGVILHSLLHPTPRKEQPGPSQQSSLSSNTVSPSTTLLNCRRKRKRCSSAHNTRQSAAEHVEHVTRSKSKAVLSTTAQGPAATLHGSSSAPCLKTCRVSHNTSSSAEDTTPKENCPVENTVSTLSGQEEMEIDTPPTAPPPSRPPPTGPRPTEPPPTGPPPTAQPPTGPPPTAPPPTGPPPTGPPPTGLPSTETLSTPTEQPPSGSATIVSPTVIPSTAIPPSTGSSTDRDCFSPPASRTTEERASLLSTYSTHAMPHIKDHPSYGSGTQGRSSLSDNGYSSPAIKSPSSGSSTDSLSPPSPLKLLAPTQTVATTPELLDTTVSPEILVPETLDLEAPIHQEWTQPAWTQVSVISDTLDFVANVAETPLIAHSPLGTTVPAKAAGIHCSTHALDMPGVSPADCAKLSTQCQHESMLKSSTPPPLADYIPDTLPGESLQCGPSIAAHQHELYSPAIPMQSYPVCASHELSQLCRTLHSSSRRKRKILQVAQEEEEGTDCRPLVEVTPQKPLENGRTDFHPPAAVLPGLRMPTSPLLPSSPRPKALRLSQWSEEGDMPICHPTPSGLPQDQPTPPGVTQDHPAPPRVPCGSGSNITLPSVLYTDVRQLESASDEPQMPVCGNKAAIPVVPATRETTPPRLNAAPLPHSESPPSVELSPTTPSSINELSYCTMADSMDTQAVAILQKTLYDKQKEIEELDDILKMAESRMQEGQEDTTVIAEQQSASTANGGEQGSTLVLGGGQRSTIVPGEQQGSTLVPGEEQDSTLVPGEEQDSTLVPGEQQGSTLVPGEEQDSTLVPGEEQDSTLVPGEQQGSTLVPGEEQDSTLVPGEEQDSTLVPGEQQGSTLVPGEEQDSTLVPGEEQDSTLVPGEEQDSTLVRGEEQDSTLVRGGGRTSMLAPQGEESTLLLNEGEAGNRSVGSDCVRPQAVSVDLQDVVDQLLGGDAIVNQYGGLEELEDEEIAKQGDTEHHYVSKVPGFEQAEKGNLQKVEAPEHHSSMQTPQEDYSGLSSSEVVAIPASLLPPVSDPRGSIVSTSPSAEAYNAAAPFSPYQEDVHVVLDSLPSETQRDRGVSNGVIRTTPTMSALHIGGERGGGSGEQAGMVVDLGASQAETEKRVGSLPNSVGSHQSKENATMLQDEMEADEVCSFSSPPLLEWRESLSQDTRSLLQESRQLIQDIRSSKVRSLTPGTNGSSCVGTTLNDEGQSTLAIVENLETFITGGIKYPRPLPAPLSSGSSAASHQEGREDMASAASQQEGGGDKAAGVCQQEGGGDKAANVCQQDREDKATGTSQLEGEDKGPDSKSSSPAGRHMVQIAARWQSARRSSKLQFGPSSNVRTPEERHKQSRTKPKRKSLPEFWQPDTVKKKKLNFFVPQSAVPVIHSSVTSSTSAYSRGVDSPASGGLSAPSAPPALHALNKRASLQSTGGPMTEERHSHGPGGKNLVVVPASPVLGRQYSLVASGLSKTQMQSLKDFVHQFDLRLASTFNHCTSHVVIATDENGQCPRTLKYLQGIAGGRWIVTFDWVHQSLRQGCLLPENVFEVSADSVTSVMGVPRMARTNHSGKGLLHDYCVMLCGEFKEMTRDQVAQLLKLSGAQLITEGEMQSTSSSRLSLIICDVGCTPLEGKQVPSRWDVVNSDWVIDSLSSFRVLPLDGYHFQQKAT